MENNNANTNTNVADETTALQSVTNFTIDAVRSTANVVMDVTQESVTLLSGDVVARARDLRANFVNDVNAVANAKRAELAARRARMLARC